MMNARSSRLTPIGSTATEQKEDERKELPAILPIMEESLEAKGGSPDIKGEKDSSPSSSASDEAKGLGASSTSSSDGDVGAEPSPARKEEVGTKRKEPDFPSITSPSQAKQARLNEGIPEETRATAKDNSETKSDDEYSPSISDKSKGTPSPSSDDLNKKVSAKGQDVGSLKAKADDTATDKKVPEESNQDIGRPLKRKGKRKGSKRTPFPVLMYQLLEDEKFQDALCWLPDGLSFAIDPNVFYEKVIQVRFPGSKFDSFKRKLNRWGFRRVGEMEAPGTMTYEHGLFRRGFPHLLSEMNGGRVMKEKGNKMIISGIPKCGSLPGPAGQSLLPTYGPSIDQQAVIAAILRGASGLSGDLGFMNGGIPSSIVGGGCMQQQFSAPGGIPVQGTSTGILSPQVEAMRGAEIDRILLEQQRLRLELAQKMQEELNLKQKLNEEVLRRRAQDQQLLEMLVARAPGAAPSPEFYLQMPIDMASGPTGFGGTMPALNQLGPYAGFDSEGTGNQGIPLGGYYSSINQNPPEAAFLQQPPDITAQMLPQAPLVSNEMELSRFRNLEQQQAQDFARLMQEEMGRHRQFGGY
jgi:hypothetical protein